MEGCDAVIHVASPYIYSAKDPQKEIVDPAVEGAKSVLLAAAKSPSVKRIVFTSSGGAVIHFPGKHSHTNTPKSLVL
jgi:nucleoside-diphosphate-sugar epimerase